MGRFAPGSPEWQSRLSKILTNRSLVRKARDSVSAREAVVLRYQKAIKRFLLEELLLRENKEMGASDRVAAAQEIVDIVLARVGTELREGWEPRDGLGFRDALYEWIHHAHWQYFRLAPKGVDDRKRREWDRISAEEILRKVWKQLLRFQNSHKGNVFHTLLALRQEYPDLTFARFSELLSQKVGRPLKTAAVRQQERRANDWFGKALLSEVSSISEETNWEALRGEFERLGFLKEYALRSKHCRLYLQALLPSVWATFRRFSDFREHAREHLETQVLLIA